MIFSHPFGLHAENIEMERILRACLFIKIQEETGWNERAGMKSQHNGDDHLQRELKTSFTTGKHRALLVKPESV